MPTQLHIRELQRVPSRTQPPIMDADEGDDNLNQLLDRQVFDPLAEDSNDPGLLRSFKELVQTDYQLAETLWAGGVFAVLLLFSQQAVRVYKHCYFAPDQMCPWDTVPLDNFDF